MAIGSVRDWRGIKHHLGEYCTEDLYSLLFNTQSVEEQVACFIYTINAELTSRVEHPLSGEIDAVHAMVKRKS